MREPSNCNESTMGDYSFQVLTLGSWHVLASASNDVYLVTSSRSKGAFFLIC